MDDYYRTHPNTTTYNNMLKMTRAFFAWAKDKCYIKENHFELIKAKKRQEKKRILIPLEQRRQIREYYERVRPEMVMVCELVYSSLIRPILRGYNLVTNGYATWLDTTFFVKNGSS